jgi:calcineurin-like phosphoesterase family protein
METFFTSDHHFDHTNMTKEGKNYSDRPFANRIQARELLITYWNETVKPHDEVYVLGDFAMGRIDESLPVAARLHGTKILLPGNHDRCWHHAKKPWEPWVDRYKDAGFAYVYNVDGLVADFGKTVVLSHFPYKGDSHDEDRYAEARPVDHGLPNWHGHVHEKWKVSDDGRMINVGVDVWDFKPVHVDQLLELTP